MINKKIRFPFSAITGQEHFKLALILNLIDISIGGVLAVGDKGTGKTTLIRSLANLMSQQDFFPFVNLPIGASEDRVLGHIHLEKLINDKTEQIVPGLLAKANKGCLYIDEINLLNDYLMDVLLDAAASGGYYLEREGLSAYLESKFCLIGSMNPEEGDVRPQLKDRFGLSVEVKTNQNPQERLQIIKNRMAFDDDSHKFSKQFEEEEKALFLKIEKSKIALNHISFKEEVYAYITNLVLEHQVEGHRADILLMKTARAYTAYLNHQEVTIDHVKTIQDFVLNHRSNISSQENNQDESPTQNPKPEEKEQNLSNSEAGIIETANNKQTLNTSVTNTNTLTKKGIVVGLDQSKRFDQQKTKSVDVKKTVGHYITTDDFEIKHKNTVAFSQKHIVFVLDSSGSMLKDKVVGFAKGAVKSITEQENTNKTFFSIITLYDDEANVILQNEKEPEQVLKQLSDIKTGGKTNMIAALKKVKPLLNTQIQNELIVLTDGKFGEATVFNQVVMAYKMYCKKVDHTTVIDADLGTVSLGMAKKFADKIGADYETLSI